VGLGLGGSGGGVGGWSVGGIASCQLLFSCERCVIERDSRSFLLFSLNFLGFLSGVLSVSSDLIYERRN